MAISKDATLMSPARGAGPLASSRADVDVLVLLGLALLLRLAFFNGAFGSDDVVYYERAWLLAHGDWSSANYNGALRYGFNLPAGLMMHLFGNSLAAANLWSLMCSLSEVLAVYVFARVAYGRRAAVFAGLLLACTPLQIAVATRIHADPVVSAALTWSFVLLFLGLRRGSYGLLFSAGLAMGWVFWAKELAAVCYFAFLPMLFFFRRNGKGFLYALSGLLLMLVLHGLLMQWLAGDPLHLVRVVTGALQRNFVQGGDGNDSAAYYLPLLFVDPRHVGLLGWLALFSLWGLWRAARTPAQQVNGEPSARLFLTMWAVGLLVVLSLFPVSLSPLRFTMKQSNYLSLLLGPLAVLGGVLLASWPARRAAGMMMLAAVLGIALAALQQADYRAFTANSKAVGEFAAAHPKALVLGSTNNANLGSLLALLHEGSRESRVYGWRELQRDPQLLERLLKDPALPEVYGVADPQTQAWFAGASQDIPACWQKQAQLQGLDLGPGNRLAAALARMAGVVPGLSRVQPRLRALAAPAPATLYTVPHDDPWCQGRASR